MRNLVVTGNRGFIGMNFMKELIIRLKDGDYKPDSITLIDAGKLKGGEFDEWMGRENYAIYTEIMELCMEYDILFHMIDKDINDCGKFIFDLSDITIVNFASESHVDNSIDDPFKVFKDNTCLVPNLIKFFGMENISKFIHIRTDEEYGHLTDVKDKPFEIGDKLKPRNPYSASKASQTLFLQSLKETFGLNVSFVTLANQFGLYQHESKMIPATIKRLLEGEPAKIYGDGSQTREWTFVEDTVNQILHHINFDEEYTHIANPNGLMSNLELVEMLIDIVEDVANIKGSYEFVEDRKGHDFCYKLKSEPYTYGDQLEDMIKTVKFYIEFYGK